MSLLKNSLLVTLVFISLMFSAQAEEIKKIKYGKVTIEELQMKSYDKDTSAEAVVLYQYAEFIPDQFMFLQHYKVKILKKSGTSSGSMVFGGRLKQFIKGQTYNLENGQIVKTKLENNSIFEECVVGDVYRTRIAMPNVQVGSVYEIYISQRGVPYSIDIQRNIPVIYAAVYFPKHQRVSFRINDIGYLGFDYKGEDKWIVKDLPSFKKEPYITSEKDYKVRMEFELENIDYSGYRYANLDFYASSWEAVTQNFKEYKDFGEKLNTTTPHLNSLSDSIKSISSNDEQLAKNCYEAIKKIKWNGEDACSVSQDLKKTYQLKQGNSADINLSLIILLRKVGLKSYPVIFSTRDNGKISVYIPTLVKFNNVLAAIELPSGTKYLDATDEYLPFGLSSERVLSCLGHPIEKGKGNCNVFIEPIKKQKKLTYSQFNLDSTGHITGKISIKRSDYNAIDFKNYLKSKLDHETYIQELETENSGWNIDNYKFNNLDDPYQDFVDEYNVSSRNTINSDDVLLINPFVIIKSKENPFQKDKRYLPISFPQKTDYNSIISIAIPANYKVVELPRNIDITNNDETARFTYQIQTTENSILINSKFYINKLKYEPLEYLSLRAVFEMMLQKQNDSIILKKI